MKKLCIGITGSFCNHPRLSNILDILVKKYDITFVVSDNVQKTKTRFGSFEDLVNILKKYTSKELILDLSGSELLGPKYKQDIMLVLPCSATTINKLEQGIYDNPVLLACKANLRNEIPIVLCIASNDFLGISGKNLLSLINRKNIYVVPFGQDDYLNKPNSLVSHFDDIENTLISAMQGKQIQPILKDYKRSD